MCSEIGETVVLTKKHKEGKKLERKPRKQAIDNNQNVVIYYCSNILFQILSLSSDLIVCFLK